MQTVVIGDACSCAAGYIMRTIYHLNSVGALNAELKLIPYQQDINSSAYVQFLS